MPPLTRRACLGSSSLLLFPLLAHARTPGSTNVAESLEQILDAAAALRSLQANWASYAVIDDEGRAGNIDAARKILGGVAPQRGEAAVEVAKVTPLYRVDGAFAAVRNAALAAPDESWGGRLDVEAFVESGEQIAFALQKADNLFYGVVFASKGSGQLSKLYDEAKASVDGAVDKFAVVLRLLSDAGAPLAGGAARSE